MREQRRQQAATHCAVHRPPLWISVWLVALVALGNPFACLLHCWYHTHDTATTVHLAVQPAVAQAHHGATHHNNHGQTTVTDQAPTKNDSSPAVPCSLTHETLSTLTIAVLVSLPRLVIPFGARVTLTVPQPLLRLHTFPPPSPPPRLAL